MNYKNFKKWEEDSKEDLFDNKQHENNLNKILSQPWWYFLIYILILLIFLTGLFTILDFFGFEI